MDTIKKITRRMFQEWSRCPGRLHVLRPWRFSKFNLTGHEQLDLALKLGLF